LSLPVTRKTSFVPWVDLVEDRFVHPASALPSRVRSQRVAGALEFGELAFIAGRVAAGVHHYSASEGVPPYNGLFLDVSAGMPFVLKTRLQLSSHRDVTYSALGAASVAGVRTTYVISSHRAEVLFNLPWRWHGRSFVGYAESRYLRPRGAEATSMPRRDHAWIVGGALLRRLGDHLSVGGIVQREKRASPVVTHTYDATLYGLTGEMHF
jgi:hypothetical protein